VIQRAFNGMLVIGDRHVSRNRETDSGELLAHPCRVGINSLAENQLVADGKDDSIQGAGIIGERREEGNSGGRL
jgi:hypothetical protein